MKKTIAALAVCVVAAAAIVHLTGCETESVGDQQITITPNSTGLLIGQFADFTASGGYEYTWSLDTPSWGLLSDTKGSTVRYTSRYEPGTTVTDTNGNVTSTANSSAMQVIRVTSRIPGSSTGDTSTNGTTTSGYTASGSAQVEHLPTPVEQTNAVDAELYITPSSATLSQYAMQEFKATGGNGEYSWSLADNSYGQLNSASGSTVVYTATYNPGLSNTVVQSLIVVSGDLSYSATIIQNGK
jgi:hypothetical protein